MNVSQLLDKLNNAPLILLTLFVLPLTVQSQEIGKRILSTVDSSDVTYITLIQEFEVNVSLDSVWNAYSTKEGWEGAFVAKAEVDFKINGTILTSYDKNAVIGDSTTIALNVLNFIPHKMITLQADIAGNFPGFTKEEAGDLYNIILFEEITASKTKIISYGVGYRNNEKFRNLMKFFIQGNEYSYNNFINYLEKGQKVKF